MLALLGIYSTTHNLESVALLCGTFLGAGLGAKVMQKKMEAQVAPTTFLSETSSSEAASQFDKPEGKGG